ncbi:hypothetical protein TNCV_3364011 [Trichonephila clavipes]|nr:hypothetical protein TNCV_3364011 [Trichonephila clavipes]
MSNEMVIRWKANIHDEAWSGRISVYIDDLVEKACDLHRLEKVRSERRFTKVIQPKRRATVLQMETNFNQIAATNISKRTVHRTLHRIGYGNRPPVQKSLMFTLNKNRRLQFAKEQMIVL